MSAFINARLERFVVELICQTIACSAWAYYQRASGEPSARAVADERLLRVLVDDWQEDYNTRRPHSALGMRAPVQFAADCAAPPITA